jgi:hypothetical protein
MMGGSPIYVDLETLHNLYDMMDKQSIEISTFLDNLAEESSFSLDDKIIIVDSDYPDIKKKAEELLERLEIEKKAKKYLRIIAKYGRLVVRPIYGHSSRLNKNMILTLDDTLLHGEHNLYSKHVKRYYDDENKIWKGWIDKDHNENDYLPIWDYVDFSLGTSLYGESMLIGLESYYPELNVLEKSLDLYRAGRPPYYLIHQIPISNLDPAEIANIINWWKYYTEVSPYMTQSGGEKQIMGSGSAIQSLFYPQPENTNTENLKILENNPNIGQIKDIEYKRGKLLGKLSLPENYFTGKELTSSTLSGLDPRFLRKVVYLQKAFLDGIDTLIQLELALNGVEYKEGFYTLRMPRNTDMLDMRDLDKGRLTMEVYEKLKEIGEDLPDLIDDKEMWNNFLIRDFLSYYFGDLLGRYDEFKKEKNVNRTRLSEKYTYHKMYWKLSYTEKTKFVESVKK